MYDTKRTGIRRKNTFFTVAPRSTSSKFTSCYLVRLRLGFGHVSAPETGHRRFVLVDFGCRLAGALGPIVRFLPAVPNRRGLLPLIFATRECARACPPGRCGTAGNPPPVSLPPTGSGLACAAHRRPAR